MLQSGLSSYPQFVFRKTSCQKDLGVASVTLRDANKKNKKANSESSAFTPFYFLNYR